MGEKKAYLSVVLIQSIYTGMFLLSKAAFDGGMNTYIFVFYRQAAGTLFLVPFAFFIERSVYYICSQLNLYDFNYECLYICFFWMIYMIDLLNWLFLFLWSLICSRKDSPPLSLITFCKIFGLSLLGYVSWYTYIIYIYIWVHQHFIFGFVSLGFKIKGSSILNDSGNLTQV